MSDFLIKNQLPIAIGLILFIALGTIVLMFENQRDKLTLEADKPKVQQAALEEKIDELNAKIANLEKKLKSARSTGTVGQVAGAKTTNSPSAPVSGLININSADEAALDTLPGIGPAKAKAIIDYRAASGGFKSIEEIKEVKGIGDVTYEKLKDQITIN